MSDIPSALSYFQQNMNVVLGICSVLFGVNFSPAAELGASSEFAGSEPHQSSQPIRKQSIAKQITVNTQDRDAVINLFKTVYAASRGVPSGWNGDVANCDAGDNSQAYKDATALRVNFFRAMAGMPGDITFDETLNAKCQQAALMMSSKGELSHYPGTDWPCYTTEGAQAAASSNLAGGAGPLAIDAYMDDSGLTNNRTVGSDFVGF